MRVSRDTTTSGRTSGSGSRLPSMRGPSSRTACTSSSWRWTCTCAARPSLRRSAPSGTGNDRGVGGACTHQQILRGSFSAVSTPNFARKLSLFSIFEIYKIYTPLHFLNPIWKPRKAPLRSVIRAKNNAPAKKQSDRSGAGGPGGKS